MNESMWDLSCLSIEANYSDEEDEQLLHIYCDLCNKKVGLFEKRYFIATKLYVDYLWTLWGLTRVPYDGEYMQAYSDGRYERLKKNLFSYKELISDKKPHT